MLRGRRRAWQARPGGPRPIRAAEGASVAFLSVCLDSRAGIRTRPGGVRWAPMETVLVSGGSGFLGGRCVVELLRRGYAVRTTVRDLAKEEEVRERVASEIDPGDRLTVLAADLRADDGWAEAVAG